MINLDHISSNPLLPEVKQAMITAIEADYHNPSSQHSKGDEAAALVDQARESVAGLINANMAKEIVFTSSGTESVNHAVKGVALANAKKGNHIVTSNIEHNAVIRSLRRLRGHGYQVTSLDVDAAGRVNPQAVAEAITDKTVMVSIMHSNNETGVIQPIEEIARITRERKIIMHTDAVDSVGVVPMDVQALGVDLMSFGSNTFCGPTGMGGLYIRRGTMVWPLLDGGNPGKQQTGRNRKPDRHHWHGRCRRGGPARSGSAPGAHGDAQGQADCRSAAVYRRVHRQHTRLAPACPTWPPYRSNTSRGRA